MLYLTGKWETERIFDEETKWEMRNCPGLKRMNQILINSSQKSKWTNPNIDRESRNSFIQIKIFITDGPISNGKIYGFQKCDLNQLIAEKGVRCSEDPIRENDHRHEINNPMCGSVENIHNIHK